MISAGVDVAKEKSVVCVMKPFGEVVRLPFEVIHTDEAIDLPEGAVLQGNGDCPER